MKAEMPYFMTNKEWYYFYNEEGKCGVRLTDKAPAEAVRSFEQYCEEIKNVKHID